MSSWFVGSLSTYTLAAASVRPPWKSNNMEVIQRVECCTKCNFAVATRHFIIGGRVLPNDDEGNPQPCRHRQRPLYSMVYRGIRAFFSNPNSIIIHRVEPRTTFFAFFPITHRVPLPAPIISNVAHSGGTERKKHAHVYNSIKNISKT